MNESKGRFLDLPATSGPAVDQEEVPLQRLLRALPGPVRQIGTVARFEFRRTRTPARLSIWLLLALFPACIMVLFRLQAPDIPEEAWGIVLYGLIPQVVCLLGLLLWVAPLLNAELEGRTWTYLAVRPAGQFAVLLGKYLNGVGWTGSAAWFGLTVSVLIARPELFEPLRLYLILSLLVVCSCVGYGAVYALLGVLFPRRAIVISVTYMLVFEVLLSNVPAVVNKLTIQYRLFNILLRGMHYSFSDQTPFEPSPRPVWFHLLTVIAIAVGYLAAAMVALRFREYSTNEQAQ